MMISLRFWGLIALTIGLVSVLTHAQSEPTSQATTQSQQLTKAQETGLREAERLISQACAGPLSDELCGDPSHRAELANQARAGLKAIETLGISAEDEGDATARIHRLQSFGELFACLGELNDSEKSKSNLISAAGSLAAYLDDSNPQIAESAKLWQGVAYRRAGKPDRALQVLRPVLTKPEVAVTGFWFRVERCRALGDQGDPAGGIALCLRLEKRVNEWFDEDHQAQRTQALNTLKIVRGSLWKRWSELLTEAKKNSEAEKARSEARAIADPILRTPEAGRCLRLQKALPE